MSGTGPSSVNFARNLHPSLYPLDNLPTGTAGTEGRQGRTPGKETFAQVKAERDRLAGVVENQAELVAENARLRLRVANLERQVKVWREAATPPEGKQECAICLVVKPVEEFYRDRSRIRGRRSYCKPCDRERYPDRRSRGGRHGKIGG